MPLLDMDHWTGAHVLGVIAGLVAAGLVGGLLWPRRAWLAGLFVGAVLPVLILINVVIGISRNPKSHNMWPFEVAIACVLSFPPALLGAAGGWGVRRVLHRTRAGATVTPDPQS
jgi:hypothetical protein